MWVEFVDDPDGYDILFTAEFPSPPRVGETVGPFADTALYKVIAVFYGILDESGHTVGAICTVEKVQK